MTAIADAPGQKRPNVLIFLAEDLGFSDVGAFGGEIQTPNIDILAKEGLRFTDFHTALACSPIRAMLLYFIGSMFERMPPDLQGKVGHEGYLNDSVVSMQELLKDAGDETLMLGKWHLGQTADRIPGARGFERSFSMLRGCHSHYGWFPAFGESRDSIPCMTATLCRLYSKDDVMIDPDDLPENFYSTDSFINTTLDYLEEKDQRGDNGPFLHKYKRIYDDGFEALQQKRVACLKKMGLVPEAAVAAPAVAKDQDGADLPEWEALTDTERRLSSKKMEAYAGMVDGIDWNIGRVIKYLEEKNELDNTIVMFFSDNGSEKAQCEIRPLTAGGDMDEHVRRWHVNSLDNMGAYNSFAWYGAQWVSASTAPTLLYKMYTSEGGIRVPFAMRYPNLGLTR